MAAQLLATLKSGQHRPRLIATPGAWDDLRARRQKDADLDAFLKRGEVEARAIVAAPPVTYRKEGRRLLGVSRVALRRVLLLALHHRLTGDPALAKRAEQEMLAAAAFPDWNPSHFLDVGEMTAALAFGHDWLYDVLDPAARKTIAAAIVAKGLKPGTDGEPAHWLRVQNNWNSVCLCGMALGALTLAEEEPELAERTLANVRAFNANGLKPYAPEGIYPEGAMYWGYGTTFQAVLLAALESALGTDWGLSRSPGFLASADALLHQLGPTGAFFNFSDNTERPQLEAGMWWYAHRLKRPDLLRYDAPHVRAFAASQRPPQPESGGDRLLPLAALWWPEDGRLDAPTKLPRHWYGDGPNQLAAFRTSWDDPKAMYLALKAGGANISHAHMDAGSFVFEADGVRWARDLGMQSYHSLESKGVDLWNSKQDGGRWKVYRLGPEPHNTLTIGDRLHRADGRASLTHFSDAPDTPGALLDLSPVFAGQAGRVARGFAFRPNSHALVRDEVEGVRPGEIVRWAMLTNAQVALAEGGAEAILTENGRRLRVRLRAAAPAGAAFEVASAQPPDNGVDAPNPDARLLVVRAAAPASGRVTFAVVLEPLGEGGRAARVPVSEPLADTPLNAWRLPPVRR